MTLSGPPTSSYLGLGLQRIKLLSVSLPESPLPELYATAAFQVQQLYGVRGQHTLVWTVVCGRCRDPRIGGSGGLRSIVLAQGYGSAATYK